MKRLITSLLFATPLIGFTQFYDTATVDWSKYKINIGAYTGIISIDTACKHEACVGSKDCPLGSGTIEADGKNVKLLCRKCKKWYFVPVRKRIKN